jgi:hypothetical protein
MIITETVPVPVDPVVTTELTGKSLKAQILLAWFTLILGLLGLWASDQPDKTVFTWMFIVGILWLIFAKVARWWKHA